MAGMSKYSTDDVMAALLMFRDATADQFTRVDRRFEAMQDQMNRRFDRVDDRFDRVDERFDRMDTRFDRMDERLDRIDVRVARLEKDHERPAS